MIRGALVAATLALAAPAAAQQGFDIVVLGEVHDNPAHHARQAEIVAALAPAALVFEMLGPEQAAAAAGIDRADAAALAQALGWEGSGWPDFAMYHPVFAAAPDAALYGAALPDPLVRQATETGAADVFGQGAADWGLGPLPAIEQAAREAEMDAAHCGMLPADLLPGMVEAQRLRDAHFARVAAAALDETGGPVVVITGNGHARPDRGIPFSLAQARPDLRVWTLGQFESGSDGAPYDAVNVTPPVPRADPCAAFGRTASRAVALPGGAS